MTTPLEDGRRRDERQQTFDSRAFYSAVDSQRRSRGMTWRKVAEESSVSASTLTRLAQGRRPDVESFASLVAWAGLAPQDFISGSRSTEAQPLTKISALLRRDPNLTPEGAAAIEQLVKVTYEQLRKGHLE